MLDFFAGSGTTGHAVLDLNNYDEGKRVFILCTNDEEIDNNVFACCHGQGASQYLLIVLFQPFLEKRGWDREIHRIIVMMPIADWFDPRCEIALR